VPGTPPGNEAGTTGGSGSQPTTQSPLSIPTLPDVVGQVPGSDQVTGRLGLPPVPGVTQ
jgi:phospholipid/cholesterol/gamma-HCH transport system substrate-binding protein